MNRIYRNKIAIIVFLAPGLLLFTGILLVPICQAIYYSLCNWNALSDPKFEGLANFKKLFTNDEIMRTALKNSLFFMIFSSISQQFLGLVLAGVLSNMKERSKNIYKNIYYLPAVLSSAALGLLWSFLFNPRMGINQVLEKMGIEGPLWLMDTKGFIILPMWVIAFVAMWQYTGSTMMLYMAKISGISKSLYEASYIDGANKLQCFTKITLPLIKPMVATTLSLNCIGSLKFFDLVYNMTQGGPGHRTDVLATHLYNEGFQYFKYGYASAIGIVLLVMCLLVTVLINKFVRTEDYEM